MCLQDRSRRDVLLIQLPRLLSYRRAEFEKLLSDFSLFIAYSDDRGSEAFGMEPNNYVSGAQLIRLKEASSFAGRVFSQRGLVRAIRKVKPTAVFIQANVRYISFWKALIYCRLTGISLISHGQGLYRYPNPGVIKRSMYRLHAMLADTYVCYNDLSQQSMIKAGVPASKLSIARNSLINRYPRPPSHKRGDELGILFIGRLRSRSRVRELIDAVRMARATTSLELELHVVGGGDEEQSLKDAASSIEWVHMHGSIYGEKAISDISGACFVGAYPGDAGLSIVHMMSLSLPPIVHSTIEAHMGPEPAYIEDNVNGFLFDRSRLVASLAATIARVASNRSAVAAAQARAFSTYEQLINPSFGDQLKEVLRQFCSSGKSL